MNDSLIINTGREWFLEDSKSFHFRGRGLHNPDLSGMVRDVDPLASLARIQMDKSFLEEMYKWNIVLTSFSIELELATTRQKIDEFWALMTNRMMMGAFRYGIVKRGSASGYDVIGNAIKRIGVYKKDPNLELFVDAANMLMIENMMSKPPDIIPNIEYVYRVDIGDIVFSIQGMLQSYQKFPSRRMLVVCALLMITEFIDPTNPSAYFESTDDAYHVTHKDEK